MSWAEAIRIHAAWFAERWFERIVATYPPDAARLMTRRTDPFANPVGGTFRKATRALIEAWPDDGPDGSGVAPHLHDIVRVRAVQDFSPSQAVGVVFLLKEVAREPLPDGLAALSPEDLAEFDRRVDDLALLAFDLYTADRERIAEIRVQESRRAMGRLLERAGFRLEATATAKAMGPHLAPSEEANT